MFFKLVFNKIIGIAIFINKIGIFIIYLFNNMYEVKLLKILESNNTTNVTYKMKLFTSEITIIYYYL